MDYVKRIGIELLSMIWEIYWGLAFGFMLSAVIRAFVSTSTISSRLGKDNAKALSLASFFGAVSSSCSYAAASMARTLLIKGASWSNAVAFMVASTNLVFEIFIVIVSVLGWSFFGGEIAGGLLLIVISAWLISRFFPAKIKDEAKAHLTEIDHQNNAHDHMHMMEGPAHQHHSHDMHQHGTNETEVPKRFKDKMLLASSHFYMDVMMVGKDILIGVIVASVIMVLVPKSFWNVLFLTDNHTLPHFIVILLNVIVGIVVAIISFVCSVGNIVMAAALWQGGISFGGVIAYILADLVTIPMLAVYRSYYGNKPMLMLLLLLIVSILISAILVDAGFTLLHWIPASHASRATQSHHVFAWNYKAILNIIFIPASIACFFIGKKQGKM
ncbi:permease [Mucilaginibacter sp. RS28]|uniref:Permease n=1 Tax=Mucilaginibacter straminoryzae TaxID=2932774 RepID=A0A9X2B862_9SPHI|nr:permease [Mucilaginibacter straminoryzae]MCJ8209131.1 permease [Mucilaginibacter straminoryzae]